MCFPVSQLGSKKASMGTMQRWPRAHGALYDAAVATVSDRATGDTVGKRADSTLDENECEIAMLNRAFGQMAVAAMEKGDAYECLDPCLTAADKAGKPRPRAAKATRRSPSPA